MSSPFARSDFPILKISTVTAICKAFKRCSPLKWTMGWIDGKVSLEPYLMVSSWSTFQKLVMLSRWGLLIYSWCSLTPMHWRCALCFNAELPWCCAHTYWDKTLGQRQLTLSVESRHNCSVHPTVWDIDKRTPTTWCRSWKKINFMSSCFQQQRVFSFPKEEVGE